MLVRDLIEILKKAPQDKQVEIVDFEGSSSPSARSTCRARPS
jgi:hypothetical protein